MNIETTQLIGAFIIAYGLWVMYRGYKNKVRARILLGAAALPAGASLFVGQRSTLAGILLALGVLLFVASLIVLRKDVAAGRVRMAPRQRPRRRR